MEQFRHRIQFQNVKRVYKNVMSIFGSNKLNFVLCICVIERDCCILFFSMPQYIVKVST